MKTITIIILAFLLFSCSAENDTVNSLPDKFTGLWSNLTEETVADVQSNTIMLEIEGNEDIVFSGYLVEEENQSQLNLIKGNERIQLTLAQDPNYMWILYERNGNVIWNRLYEKILDVNSTTSRKLRFIYRSKYSITY